jgi:hypothetical protein
MNKMLPMALWHQMKFNDNHYFWKLQKQEDLNANISSSLIDIH